VCVFCSMAQRLEPPPIWHRHTW